MGRRGQRVLLPCRQREEVLPGTREPPSCWGHGGDACFCSTVAEKKSLYFGEKTSFAIHLALCRGGAGADKMGFFATWAPAPSGDSVVAAFGMYIPMKFLWGCLDLRWRKAQGMGNCS